MLYERVLCFLLISITLVDLVPYASVLKILFDLVGVCNGLIDFG